MPHKKQKNCLDPSWGAVMSWWCHYFLQHLRYVICSILLYVSDTHRNWKKKQHMFPCFMKHGEPIPRFLRGLKVHLHNLWTSFHIESNLPGEHLKKNNIPKTACFKGLAGPTPMVDMVPAKKPMVAGPTNITSEMCAWKIPTDSLLRKKKT